MKKRNRSKHALAIAALSLATLFTSCKKEAEGPLDLRSEICKPSSELQSVEGRYIVSLNDNASSADQIKTILTSNGIDIGSFSKDDVFPGGFVTNITTVQADKLRNDPRVGGVEQDQIMTAQGTDAITTAVDLKTTQQDQWWGKKMGHKDGTGKTAWIIDSGVDMDHPDLNVDASRSISYLTSADGGNWSSPDDEYGHGTRLAGIIGAKDNGIGVVGIAPNTSIVSVKVMNKTGGCYVSNLVKGINYVAANAQAGDVANISIQAGSSLSLDAAVKNLAAKGVYISIAAGNSKVDIKNYSPQHVEATNVYTVSGMDSLDTYWTNSNYGLGVDYTAPGAYVKTTAMGGGYQVVSGTSYASPMLGGILLTNSGAAGNQGTVKNDPDSKKDVIPKNQ